MTIKYGDHVLEVEAKVSGGHPGKLTGPWENCYPAEGPVVEIESISMLRKRKTGRGYIERALPEAMFQRLATDEYLLEKVAEAYGDQ